MDFYKILEDIMQQKSISIPDVARMCNLPDSTIRSIISRKSKTVALEVAFKISKGLNVSLEELTLSEEKYQKLLQVIEENKDKEIPDIFD